MESDLDLGASAESQSDVGGRQSTLRSNRILEINSMARYYLDSSCSLEKLTNTLRLLSEDWLYNEFALRRKRPPPLPLCCKL